MDDGIQSDLLAAHADALLSAEEDYYTRYSALFPEETRRLAPLFELAEQVYAFFNPPVRMRAEFRADLKAGLLAEARQQQLDSRSGWSWAAIGAASAVTVAGIIAAAAWRGNHGRASH